MERRMRRRSHHVGSEENGPKVLGVLENEGSILVVRVGGGLSHCITHIGCSQAGGNRDNFERGGSCVINMKRNVMILCKVELCGFCGGKRIFRFRVLGVRSP